MRRRAGPIRSGPARRCSVISVATRGHRLRVRRVADVVRVTRAVTVAWRVAGRASARPFTRPPTSTRRRSSGTTRPRGSVRCGRNPPSRSPRAARRGTLKHRSHDSYRYSLYRYRRVIRNEQKAYKNDRKRTEHVCVIIGLGTYLPTRNCEFEGDVPSDPPSPKI